MNIINTIDEKYINCNDIHLKGKHNHSNIIAALEISKLFKISFNLSVEALKKIMPLEHRMELILKNNSKIKFINDCTFHR